VLIVHDAHVDVRGPIRFPAGPVSPELGLLTGALEYLIFLVLLLTALAQWVMWRRRGDTIAETYVFGLYVFGHLMLASTLVAAFGGYRAWSGVAVLYLIKWAYVAWALRCFYGLQAALAPFAALLLVTVQVVAQIAVLSFAFAILHALQATGVVA
jgi:hypothetical protein